MTSVVDSNEVAALKNKIIEMADCIDELRASVESYIPTRREYFVAAALMGAMANQRLAGQDMGVISTSAVAQAESIIRVMDRKSSEPVRNL